MSINSGEVITPYPQKLRPGKNDGDSDANDAPGTPDMINCDTHEEM